MARARRLEDLIAWQRARSFSKSLRPYYGRMPMCRDFDMVDQLRRSSRSIMANIAEGFGRAGPREFHRFLSNANGSIAETRSHLYNAFDHEYITEAELSALLDDCDEIGRIVGGLQASIRRRLDGGEGAPPP